MTSSASDMPHLRARCQLCLGTAANYVMKSDTAPATQQQPPLICANAARGSFSCVRLRPAATGDLRLVARNMLASSRAQCSSPPCDHPTAGTLPGYQDAQLAGGERVHRMPPSWNDGRPRGSRAYVG